MNRNLLSAALALCGATLHLPPAAGASENQHATGESVVVLHGLARSSGSMSKMAHALEQAGFHVCNVSYPSRSHSVETLASDFVAPSVKECAGSSHQPVHFVTHSLGGIIVRHLAASPTDIKIGRVVMLSPPNQGSEVVDKLGGLYLFKLLNGPAGAQLGTGAASLPRTLGAPTFELGVITGRRSVNPFLSMLIPGRDDGKVAVVSARVVGMKDFLSLPSSHPFIMKNSVAIEQTLHFLRNGAFQHPVRGDQRRSEMKPMKLAASST